MWFPVQGSWQEGDSRSFYQMNIGILSWKISMMTCDIWDKREVSTSWENVCIGPSCLHNYTKISMMQTQKIDCWALERYVLRSATLQCTFRSISIFQKLFNLCGILRQYSFQTVLQKRAETHHKCFGLILRNITFERKKGLRG